MGKRIEDSRNKRLDQMVEGNKIDFRIRKKDLAPRNITSIREMTNRLTLRAVIFLVSSRFVSLDRLRSKRESFLILLQI